jgi:hypothetical protein
LVSFSFFFLSFGGYVAFPMCLFVSMSLWEQMKPGKERSERERFRSRVQRKIENERERERGEEYKKIEREKMERNGEVKRSRRKL